MMNVGLEKLLEIHGTKAEIARQVGATGMQVQQWFARDRVPAAWCHELKRIGKRKVTLHDLKPEIFGTGRKKPSNGGA